MESRKPPEFGLEVSADRTNIKDVIRGNEIALHGRMRPYVTDRETRHTSHNLLPSIFHAFATSYPRHTGYDLAICI